MILQSQLLAMTYLCQTHLANSFASPQVLQQQIVPCE